jgi:hypothetical protein
VFRASYLTHALARVFVRVAARMPSAVPVELPLLAAAFHQPGALKTHD